MAHPIVRRLLQTEPASKAMAHPIVRRLLQTGLASKAINLMEDHLEVMHFRPNRVTRATPKQLSMSKSKSFRQSQLTHCLYPGRMSRPCHQRTSTKLRTRRFLYCQNHLGNSQIRDYLYDLAMARPESPSSYAQTILRSHYLRQYQYINTGSLSSTRIPRKGARGINQKRTSSVRVRYEGSSPSCCKTISSRNTALA